MAPEEVDAEYADVLAQLEQRRKELRRPHAPLTANRVSFLPYEHPLHCLCRPAGAGRRLGYARAKSVPSLVAGVAAAVLTVVAVLLLPHHPRAGLGLGILVSLALGAFFFQRYQETKKPMPALLVLTMSVIVLLASVLRLAGVFHG